MLTTIRVLLFFFLITLPVTAANREAVIDINREMEYAKGELQRDINPSANVAKKKTAPGNSTKVDGISNAHTRSYFKLLTPTPKEKNPIKGTISAGMVYIPFNTTDMNDIHVSDWQNYGTLSMEGRASLPLSRAKKNGIFPGLTIGLEGPRDIPFILEYQSIVFSTFSFNQILLGNRVGLMDTPFLDFFFVPKIGYAFLNMNFGTVQMLPGKLQPIITPEGTFYNGDKLSAEISGILLQLNLEATLRILKNCGIYLGYGYNFSFLSDLVIKAGNIELDYDSPTLVKPILDVGDGNSSTVQAGVRPKVNSNGNIAILKFFYEF